MHKLLEKINLAFIRNIIRKLVPLFAKLGLIFKPFKAFIKKHNDILNPVIVLTSICLIVSAALSLTNSLTANRIEQMNLQNKKAEMAALLPAENYSEGLVMWESADPNLSIYEAKTGENVTGYIITTTAKGYGGEIIVMTAFNPDKTVKGISILNAEDETPGLGQNITRLEFYSQFNGLNTEALVVKDSADNTAGEIKAVTGATISSKGVVKAVNLAREELNAYLTVEATKNDGEVTNDEPLETPVDNGGGEVEE